MKKVILLLNVILFVFVMVSCQKQKTGVISNELSNSSQFVVEDYKDKDVIISYLNDYDSQLNNKAPKWWKKIKKWIKAHTGTYLFENCSGSSSCGPCPGICLTTSSSAGVVSDNYVLSQQELNNGERTFVMQPFGNNLMVVFFDNYQDFIKDGNFYIEEIGV